MGADAPITRRDFIGSLAIGSGAALLGMPAPGTLGTARSQTVPYSMADLTPAWTGLGGLGERAGRARAVISNQVLFEKL